MPRMTKPAEAQASVPRQASLRARRIPRALESSLSVAGPPMSAVSLRAPARPWVTSQQFAGHVLERIRGCFDANCIVEALDAATHGDLYIFGGSVRRTLLNDPRFGDLDLMVPNGDLRAFRALDALRVPFELNRQRHHRYRWNRQQVDMLEPREFYRGFHDVQGALRYFDLKINALAVHVGSRKVLDPFQQLSRARPVDPGINWPRWDEMSPLELAVLALRFVRILHEAPGLTISLEDAERLRNDVVPRMRHCDWAVVHDRFPSGKDAFLQLFHAMVLSRVRTTRKP